MVGSVQRPHQKVQSMQQKTFTKEELDNGEIDAL
jgi:hypothetical protein